MYKMYSWLEGKVDKDNTDRSVLTEMIVNGHLRRKSAEEK